VSRSSVRGGVNVISVSFKSGPHFIAIIVGTVAFAQLPGPQQTALDRISADSLRTNLTYLASDEVEGRLTPSRGLDLAADYIAKQFKDAGLEPAAKDGTYFQRAAFEEGPIKNVGLQLRSGTNELTIPADVVRVRSFEALDLVDAVVSRLPPNGVIPAIAGKIVAGEERRYGGEITLNELQARKPALILLIARTRTARRKGGDGPEGPPPELLDEVDGNHAPVIRVRKTEARALLQGRDPLTISVRLPRPAVHPVTLRNVAAILRGSDLKLKDQYILVTAHYDHLGRNAKGVFYGANDNGSGTVSVIEIARGLAAMNPHPKRSIVFITLFGEEEGLLGSYYYTHHPLFPLKNTVVNINLEQMGRTDDPAGKKVGEFLVTGPSFSNVAAILGDAAKPEDVRVYNRKDADDYFDRSDNYSFAQFGVVSHTVVVAVDYPDYHALGDKVEKIDFANMAKVDRGVAAGILRIANDAEPPVWSDAPGAAIYKNAGR
jgi:hypothetical protein